MGFLGNWHWLIVLQVVVLILGTRELRNMACDLAGSLMKRFKEGRADDEPVKQLDESGRIIES
jgi:TatA/E family protein of Tat protein translocase